MQLQKMREQYDNQKKKFRRIKSEKLNSENLFTLDDTYKMDDPLLDKEQRQKDQERNIGRNLADMAHMGKEAEMIATDTAGELGRNKATIIATHNRVGSSNIRIKN